MSVFQGLKPEKVWKQFEAICNIPHPSGHEQEVAQYVVNEAKRLGLAVKRDDVGNVCVTKPAAKGHESAQTVILQGHLDMVGVAAPGVKHDFTKDPIKCKIDGKLVKAEGTTLGADNGIGGAIMLALMEEDFKHGEIEFLFTVNEEAGMDGAHGLNASFVKGRRLINLDTEEWGEFYISCAGGGDSVITLPVTRERQKIGFTAVHVKISGLKGGHSGVDINLGRGSGNRIIGRLLAAAYDINTFHIVRISGGNKRNSIADGAEAEIFIPVNNVDSVVKSLNSTAEIVKRELATTDPGMKLSIETKDKPSDNPISEKDSKKIIDLLVALPHGVLAMSPEVPGLVETSTNIGVVGIEKDTVKISLLTRSAVTSALDALKLQIRTIAHFVGAKIEEPKGYPGWKPNINSELLKISKEVFKKMNGKDPAIKAIHAGLECGLFGEKLPGVDMLSIGPEMHNVHSPAEELDIASIPKTYDLIKEILKALG
ncbi:MAG: hypothetical protein A2161_21460 [Candidatus Schekmanbacteria bacterium RBG_13_48_7]|uniref:Cytosol non-specific dipeptidase n=1 Tax=Candidatus Schekmanbacteria bacterium RBG_13_48_7 TaxID=1817878 RepID=A0A1F7RRP2_9BACT|nr:MAG: hypothetical protein A2161_21460 [Candidatus Schekmanbacteria bacterium RBG_13_48_7]